MHHQHISHTTKHTTSPHSFSYTLYIEYEIVNGTRYVPRADTPRMYGCAPNTNECSCHLEPAFPSATIPKDTLVLTMNGTGNPTLDFGCKVNFFYEDPASKKQLPGSPSSCDFHLQMPDEAGGNNGWRPMCPGYGSFTATLLDDCIGNDCDLVDHIMYVPGPF